MSNAAHPLPVLPALVINSWAVLPAKNAPKTRTYSCPNAAHIDHLINEALGVAKPKTTPLFAFRSL